MIPKNTTQLKITCEFTYEISSGKEIGAFSLNACGSASANLLDKIIAALLPIVAKQLHVHEQEINSKVLYPTGEKLCTDLGRVSVWIEFECHGRVLIAHVENKWDPEESVANMIQEEK